MLVRWSWLKFSEFLDVVHRIFYFSTLFWKAVENVARRMSTPGFSIDKIEENLDREIKEDLQKEEEHGLRKMWVQKYLLQ